MTVLVTGATGTVGRHIVRGLIDRGQQVRALTRNPATAALPDGAEVAAGDLADPGTLSEAFEGVEAMHLISFADAAYSPLRTAPEVLELALRAGVRRITVLTGFAPGPVERAVEAAGVEWTHVQPVEFMANALAWSDAVRAGVVEIPFAHTRSAMVHEADIAAVAVTALVEDGHSGKAYTVTGPEAISYAEAVRTVGEVVGKPIRLVELTEEQARAEFREAGYSEAEVDEFVELGSNPPEHARTVAPTVREVTGTPGRTFAEWVAENAAAFR
ncbi:NAD(P)H-binding protein [Saccharopolyspora indica]|uniref:NAD(P)H-binding protein n=1 Tax=Saccharopolyspora indica TaxID=1229659 RepID=UPI0022EB5495|nr:NAD(P)H-binding protein [Saccharopolyspora indica]MDA3645728.1 NAD(P)H-binding protein [Saccharopolyspora indica]